VPSGQRPRPVPGTLYPLPRAELNTASQHRMPVALLVMFVLVILTLCIAAAATRFSRPLR
jgi:hypothetical protein